MGLCYIVMDAHSTHLSNTLNFYYYIILRIILNRIGLHKCHKWVPWGKDPQETSPECIDP